VDVPLPDPRAGREHPLGHAARKVAADFMERAAGLVGPLRWFYRQRAWRLWRAFR
jgi:hypothetical protein